MYRPKVQKYLEEGGGGLGVEHTEAEGTGGRSRERERETRRERERERERALLGQRGPRKQRELAQRRFSSAY